MLMRMLSPFAAMPLLAMLGFSVVVACGADDASPGGDGTGPVDERDAGNVVDSGTPPDASDGGGDAGNTSPFGTTSCQPAFEQACQPPITFVNGDPNGRGKTFTDAIPDVEAAEKEIACTACSILYRAPSEIPSGMHPTKITITLTKVSGGAVAVAGGEKIDVDLDYIASWKGEDAAAIKQELLGVLQHETVHLYQNFGNVNTREGVADLVHARTGYYSSDRWEKEEGTWKDPYTISGNFFSWLTGPCSFHSTFYSGHDLDFPYKLNAALAGKDGNAAYTAVSSLIQATFGKDVDALWTEYQATAF